MRYLWAAYRQGSYLNFPVVPKGLSAPDFADFLAEFLPQWYVGAWVQIGQTPRGEIPVGVIHGRPFGGLEKPGVLISDMQWFPWASKRNIAESFINFVNEGRREAPLYAIAPMKDKPIAEYACKHGIMRRMGTSENWHAAGKSALYESR